MNNFNKTLLAAALSCILYHGGGSFVDTANAASGTLMVAPAEVTPPAESEERDEIRHKPHGHHGRKFVLFKDTAALLDMTEKDLKNEWKKGKSLQQIAKEKKNWDADVFVQKLTAVQSAKLDNAVKAGKMTQQQADMLKKKLPGSLKRFTQHKYEPKQNRRLPAAHSEI
ncbi:hypothetical protein [Paenibacillus azoreducens]|uniref:Uncharacterized protein n=1 Tax=Paenibacillus azoreducens TaxID=116718 RepID=A0A919YAT2_9BACL|nr:hypothetical protein [Paenibacillus azoreducens]GIO48156.1 hypothetical protein J34TS1_29210 [Paenibacillus azoreducens]